MKSALSIFLALLAPLAAFSPELHLIHPRGGQRGTEMVVNFDGERLEELTEALFYEPGLTLSNIEVKDGKHAIAKLTIAADATLGEHSLRLRSPGGLTELRSFWVGQFPSVAEVEPNATFDQAQRIDLNRTVEGIAANEDADYYVCSLKKGQRLSVEVEAMRLGRVFFDAYVAIIDPKKFELASCDDTPLLRNDAFASIIAPEDGDYRVVVHEAAYEGNDQCQYRLHIGTFPRPKAVFPSGGKPGETIEFTFIGDPSGPIQQSITLPADASERFPVFPQSDGLLAASPHWITVSPLESIRDIATNHDAGSAVPVPPIPCAMHGILDGDAKSDWFKFSAKKDQKLVVRVLARSHRSPLDSVLSIHQADGKQLAQNDDQGAPDSVINWTCPGDGDYCLQIHDQLKRSGADFTYRIEITNKSPALAATEQGKSTSMLAKIETLHPFEGPATVELIGLPLGATCPSLTFTKDQTELTFPITVAADAKVGKHNGLFCRVSVPGNGTTILHQTAMNSTLRIDAPSPTPVAKAESKAPDKPADPQAKAEPGKPLSRLEQLRQRAK